MLAWCVKYRVSPWQNISLVIYGVTATGLAPPDMTNSVKQDSTEIDTAFYAPHQSDSIGQVRPADEIFCSKCFHMTVNRAACNMFEKSRVPSPRKNKPAKYAQNAARCSRASNAKTTARNELSLGNCGWGC